MPFGIEGDVPLMGRWTRWGVGFGIYRPGENSFHLEELTPAGSRVRIVSFGSPGDLPVVGDWNGDGLTTIGVFRPSSGTFYLRNSNSAGTHDEAQPFGRSGDVPLVGDWDGSGRDRVAVYRPSERIFYLRLGPAESRLIAFGRPGDLPVSGDWDGDGRSGLGVFRPSAGRFLLWNELSAPRADDGSIEVVSFGEAGEIPLTAPGWPMHAGQPSQRHEHLALLDLVPTEASTHIAVRDGAWNSPETWQRRRVPAGGGRVWIPKGRRVVLDVAPLDRAERWLRVDGALEFDPERDTGLYLRTLVVSESGRLSIGEPGRRIAPDKRATLRFSDRGARDRAGDPLDLDGGLVSLGIVSIHGAEIVGHVATRSDLDAGRQVIPLAEPARGWRRGDLVLIPGTDPISDQDETRRIASIAADSRAITLAEPLAHRHAVPAGASLRVGNLSRNVVLESEVTDPVERRAHVMFMHRPTGVEIEGALFRELGRTDVRTAHTFPVMGPDGLPREGTDANTIGRYALHFHVRSGVRRDRDPHVVRDCAIVGGPKHGLVNHGGHVVAEGNVTFRLNGSHFFAENGSEVGAFRDNLAVRSNGSIPVVDGDVMSRMYITDFGHHGHGFWMQGGGVDVVGNFAFGHTGAAYAYNGLPMKEEGQWVFFDPENARPEHAGRLRSELGPLRPGDVPLVFVDNEAGTSLAGLELWYMQLHSAHAIPSRVADSFFWGITADGVRFPYTRRVEFRDVTVLAAPRGRVTFGFGRANETTGDLDFGGVRAEGFSYGIDLPTYGTNDVVRSDLDNDVDLRIRAGPGRNLEIALQDVTFGTSGTTDIRMVGLPGKIAGEIAGTAGFAGLMRRDADISPLFGSVRVTRSSTSTGEVEQIYFREQASDARPFAALGIPALAGLSAGEAWSRHRLAIGGLLAASDARERPGVDGLVGSVQERPPLFTLESPTFTNQLAGHVVRGTGPPKRILTSEPTDLEEGWNVVPVADGVGDALVFGDTTPPVFELDAAAPRVINPADLRFGMTLRGSIADRVGAFYSRRLHVEELVRLVPAAENDSVIELEVDAVDLAGNVSVETVRFAVSDEAPSRGANSTRYLQIPDAGAGPPAGMR